MTKSASKIKAKLQVLAEKREDLQAELELAVASETLEKGATYSIKVGRGENRETVDAVLVAQRTNEKGATEYRFQYGDEFEAKFVNGTARLLASAGDGEGEIRSSAVVSKLLEKLADDITALETDLEDALAREQLVVGATYQIKIGRGENAVVTYAVLLGEGVEVKTSTVEKDGVTQTKTKETKLLNFYHGEGFAARTVLVTANALVFATEAADTAEAQAEVAAETAAEQAAE